jgi:hypothetical protein
MENKIKVVNRFYSKGDTVGGFKSKMHGVIYSNGVLIINKLVLMDKSTIPDDLKIDVVKTYKNYALVKNVISLKYETLRNLFIYTTKALIDHHNTVNKHSNEGIKNS